jgi:phosphatidylserine decarboxylase
MLYYNRKNKKYEEEIEYQKGILKFLYKTVPGRFALWLFVARPWFSELRAIYQNSPRSKKDIIPFIEKYKVNENKEYAKQAYKCFNDFFTRKKALTIEEDAHNILVSPADCKMQFFDVTDDLKLNIKQSTYDVKDILDNKHLAEFFHGGTCIVCRLCVDDYHRYHYIDSGKQVYHRAIKGKLHTVRPISEKYKVYSRNSREVSVLELDNFGTVAYVEVGALMIGRIVNHEQLVFRKFEEKGYFEFGGSTIVLFFDRKIEFDEDIRKANADGYEVKVSAGERIGIC